jgi:sugar O-acyltransferase (sialic acid O-acetyltransferase NeuD family)
MDILIAGAGGHGRVVLDILRAAKKPQYTPVAFLDANEALHGSQVAGVPVLGHLNLLPKLKKQGVAAAIVAIGDNRARASYAAKLAAAGLALINAIHPSAVISPTATLGQNIVIAPGVIVCTDARIADNVILNTAATIDHECDIRDSAHICPGVRLAGRVTIGQGALIGIGACILPCLKIGDHATVGGGALVRRDVPPHTTVVGVPARAIPAQQHQAA